MKALSKLVMMEMSNIHFFKPGRNVRKKEMLFMGMLSCLVAVSGVVFLNQAGDAVMKQASITVVFLLSLIASLYDLAVRINGILYDYEQYQMISYLPVDHFQILLSKLISMTAVTWRWQVMIGFSFSVVYALRMHLPLVCLLTCLLLLTGASVWMALAGAVLMFLYHRAKRYAALVFGVLSVFLGIWARVIYGNMANADYIFRILQNPVVGLTGTAAAVLLLPAWASVMKSDYTEVLARIGHRAVYGRKIKNEIKNADISNALFFKERRAFFSFKMYLLNTLAPVLFFSVGLIALCFVPEERIVSLLLESGYEREIESFFPLFFCFMFGMACPTYCSLSLEGKAMDLLKSKPIQFRDLMLAKIRLYIFCVFPLISVDAFAAGLAVHRRISLANALFLICLSLLFASTVGTVGILLDILFGNFEWINPVSAVKQSISMPLQMLSCLALAFIPLCPALVFELHKSIFYGIVSIIWSLVGISIYTLSKKFAKKKLNM
ncbi:MAG: hypothetical protein IJ711_02980 [Lachnospiraceae bacterium]|nr:hypothetical protein [Lachnospiraceae bacterium]